LIFTKDSGLLFIFYSGNIISMGTKIISIREEVYENLKSLKREDESISDVVERLITKKKN
jgi:hypothetical protein